MAPKLVLHTNAQHLLPQDSNIDDHEHGLDMVEGGDDAVAVEMAGQRACFGNEPPA